MTLGVFLHIYSFSITIILRNYTLAPPLLNATRLVTLGQWLPPDPEMHGSGYTRAASRRDSPRQGRWTLVKVCSKIIRTYLSFCSCKDSLSICS